MDASMRCSACQDVLTDAVTCAACEAPHHADCWRARGHCVACLSGKPPVPARRSRSGLTVSRALTAVAAGALAVFLIPRPPAPPPHPPPAKVQAPAVLTSEAWHPVEWLPGPKMMETPAGFLVGRPGANRVAIQVPTRAASTLIVWARVAHEAGRRSMPEAQLSIAVADSTQAPSGAAMPWQLVWRTVREARVLDRATRPIKMTVSGFFDRLSFAVRNGESVSIERIVLLEQPCLDARAWVPRAALSVRALHRDSADLVHSSWANAHVPARLIRRTGPAPAPVLISISGMIVRLGPSERGVQVFSEMPIAAPPDRRIYERRLLEQLDPPRPLLARHVEPIDLDLTLLSDGTAEVVAGGQDPFAWPLTDPEHARTTAGTLTRDRTVPPPGAIAGILSAELARRAPPGTAGRRLLIEALDRFASAWSEEKLMPVPLAAGDRVELVCASGAELVAERYVDGLLRLVERQPPPGVEAWSGWVPQRFFEGNASALVGHTLRFTRTGERAVREN